MDKQRFTTALARYVFNPIVRALFQIGVTPPGTAILGRRPQERPGPPHASHRRAGRQHLLDSGRARAEGGYVRNIEADPRVRVRVGRRWRAGTAHVVPDDDPRERLRAIAERNPRARLNAATVRVMQTGLLTIRVDLDERP